MNNIENYLEDVECAYCPNVGMVSIGGYSYICPVCHREGSLLDDPSFEECNDDEDILRDMICPECERLGRCEFITDEDGDHDGDSYRCTFCGHEGSIQEDNDARDYYWKEMLCGYAEDEKGEVNDNYDN